MESCGYPDPTRAHTVLGTDRETGFKTCFAPYMQAGSSIMDGRTVRRTVLLVYPSPGSLSSSFSPSLFNFFFFQIGHGRSRNNPQTRGEFEPSSAESRRPDDSSPSSSVKHVTRISRVSRLSKLKRELARAKEEKEEEKEEKGGTLGSLNRVKTALTNRRIKRVAGRLAADGIIHRGYFNILSN